MAVYFIADTHFGHEGIIKLSNRPFADLDEMTAIMVQSWNMRVTAKDDIYIVGDFCFRGGHDRAIQMAKRLNGRKHLIVGNHDITYLEFPNYREQFVEIADMLQISIDGERIILCHYPIAEWHGYHRGSWHIYGHIHNRKDEAFAYMRTQERALNAGADITQYMPVTFSELKQYNDIFKSSP